jgi:hypothetical protein
MYTNSCIVYANLTVSPQTIGSYRGSILLGYAIRLVDPENDALANGDRLSNLVICLGGTMTSADIAEARLYRDNGAGQFNYGCRNNGRTNNLLMGVGTYSNGCYVFTHMSNNLIANSVSGGYDWAYLALRLATNATVGRTVNPYVRENGIGMQSTGSAKTGGRSSRVQRERPAHPRGYFVANEWSDADWAAETITCISSWRFTTTPRRTSIRRPTVGTLRPSAAETRFPSREVRPSRLVNSRSSSRIDDDRLVHQLLRRKSFVPRACNA